MHPASVGRPVRPGARVVAPCTNMEPALRLAWLFDVDGTLLLTDGAAKQAFVLAVRDLLGRDDPLDDIAFAGRIDPRILGDILAKHGVEPSHGLIHRFWDTIVMHMHSVLHPGRGRLMPGVPPLLDAIAAEPQWGMALLTGNFTRMAELKLRHFGLAGRFAFGAFGEEAGDRDELACLAVRRVAERWGLPPRHCIVVGDTVHDIACARAAGARVVAVATGYTPRAELEARGPDLALDDLTDPAALLAWARELERNGG